MKNLFYVILYGIFGSLLNFIFVGYLSIASEVIEGNSMDELTKN
jgi:hypothetical protein